MKLERILPFARSLLKTAVSKGDIAIDATVGNGHDTLYLANLVEDTGYVYGFDVQQQAIKKTTERLRDHNVVDRVTLFHESHDQLRQNLPNEAHGKISGAIFNLGYLPGGDKSIVTKPDSTIRAIEQLLEMMQTESMIVLVIYYGHPEGIVEKDTLLDYVKNLDQQKAHVLQYQFINQMNHPPFIIAIEKR